MIGNKKAAKGRPGFCTVFLSPLLFYFFTNVLLFA